MGLDQDFVDGVDVDAFLVGAHGPKHAADAKVPCAAEDAVGGADNQIDGGLSKGIVSQFEAVEFGEDKGLHVIGV